MEEDVRSLDEAGVDMVLTKPLRSALLAALLRYVARFGFCLCAVTVSCPLERTHLPGLSDNNGGIRKGEVVFMRAIGFTNARNAIFRDVCFDDYNLVYLKN